jgi:hypothetical protein
MRIIAALAICGVVLAGCGEDAGSGSGAPSAPEPTSPATGTTPLQPLTNTPMPSGPSTAATPGKRTGTVIKPANSQFGMMLFDGTGQAIYLSTRSRPPNRSATAPVPKPGHPY